MTTKSKHHQSEQQPLRREIFKVFGKGEKLYMGGGRETSEPPRNHEHQSNRFCAFIERILYIGFHAYLTYFTNSCFHCFE